MESEGWIQTKGEGRKVQIYPYSWFVVPEVEWFFRFMGLLFVVATPLARLACWLVGWLHDGIGVGRRQEALLLHMIKEKR